MDTKDILEKYPLRRPKAYDGMSVTADIWEEAHQYHHQLSRMHSLFSHGPGIVTGLEVIASDPPDSTVYVLPGIAVDPLGRSIVLAEPVGYDFGTDAQGVLHLMLSYGESERSGEQQEAGEPLYVTAEFVIQAQLAADGSPAVRLARVRRKSKGDPINDAADPAHPGDNEIDLRFRREIGPDWREPAAVGVAYAGDGTGTGHGRGVDHLARALSRAGLQIAVDDGIALDVDLGAYALLYLVGSQAFQLEGDEMDGLYAFHQAGGTLLIESCRQGTDGGDPPADGSFRELLGTLGIDVEPVGPGHPLLAGPFLFAAPPMGFETQGEPDVWVGDGVVWSGRDYGCLWQGQRRGQPPSREEIRAAMEWGHNVVAYAVERQKRG